jgi:hypothetical protein
MAEEDDAEGLGLPSGFSAVLMVVLTKFAAFQGLTARLRNGARPDKQYCQ